MTSKAKKTRRAPEEQALRAKKLAEQLAKAIGEIFAKRPKSNACGDNFDHDRHTPPPVI